MRILLVHDAEEARARIVQMLVKGLPEAVVEMWDPARRGLPSGVDWQRFDVAFVDARAPVEPVLAWLRRLHADGATALPAFVAMGTAQDAGQSAPLKEAGAFAYIAKDELSPERVQQLVRSALRAPVRVPVAAPDHNAALDLLSGTSLDISTIGQPIARASNVPHGYQVLRKIADGGMSKVYLARRDADGAVLVLKLIDPRLHQDPLFRKRFVREYKLLAKISNEHVVAILDQGMTDTYGYIATEYFAAGDLKARIRAGGMAPEAVLSSLLQIALALEAVHAAGIVHRDLKPQNIMYRDDSRLALVDFGLAREMDGTSTLTQHGVVLATPLYMSPEQCLGNEIDGRSDLYSVGVLVYEMLTGRPPYIGRNPPELAYHHVHSPVPKLPARLHKLQPLIDRMMAKDPANRFPTARALIDFIERM